MIRRTNYTHEQTRNFDKNFEGKIRGVDTSEANVIFGKHTVEKMKGIILAHGWVSQDKI